MSDEIVNHAQTPKDAGTLAAGVSGGVALALCCGGGLIAATLGLGALAALLVNPWFLFPVVLVTAGAVYWRTNRSSAACEVEPRNALSWANLPNRSGSTATDAPANGSYNHPHRPPSPEVAR